MPARILLAATICILLFTTSQSTAQSVGSRPQSQTAATASDSSDEAAAMKADLAKMRVLVTQMQNNLGLTTNSTTPLYHQFDLEIQMWQLLIAQMERRVESMERSRSPNQHR